MPVSGASEHVPAPGACHRLGELGRIGQRDLPKGAEGHSGASLVPAERDPPDMGEMPADIAVQHGHRPADQTESDCCLPPVPSSGRV